MVWWSFHLKILCRNMLLLKNILLRNVTIRKSMFLLQKNLSYQQNLPVKMTGFLFQKLSPDYFPSTHRMEHVPPATDLALNILEGKKRVNLVTARAYALRH